MSTFRGISFIRGLGQFVSTSVVSAVDEVTGTTVAKAVLPYLPTKTFYCTLRSTTGYVTFLDWDNTTVTVGDGNPINDLPVIRSFTNTTPIARNFTFYSSDSLGNRSGNLLRFSSSENSLSSINVKNCSMMSVVHITQDDTITSVDVSGMTSLEVLYVYGDTYLNTLNYVGTNLKRLIIGGTGLTGTIDVSQHTLLELLYTYNTNISSVTGLQYCTLLYDIVAHTMNNLTSFDISGLTNMQRLIIYNCSTLTSLRAVGVGSQMASYTISTYYSGFGFGISLINCDLNSTALNQLYTDLASGSGNLLVTGNPGTASDNTAIATAKGYSVFG